MATRNRPGKKERLNSFNFQKPSDGAKPASLKNGKPSHGQIKRNQQNN